MEKAFLLLGILLFTLHQAESTSSSASALTPPILRPPVTCVSNDSLSWLFYKGNCYASIPPNFNFLYFDPAVGAQIDRAIQTCLSFDALLPRRLTSKSQVVDIVNLLNIQANATNSFFVGAFATSYLNFKWGPNQDVDTSQNLFLPGEPNNHYGTENIAYQGCVSVEFYLGEWGLNDIPCNYAPQYILPNTIVCQRCSTTPRDILFNVVYTFTSIYNKNDLTPNSGFFNATTAAKNRNLLNNEYLKRVVAILNNSAVSIYNSTGTEKDIVYYDNGRPTLVVKGPVVPISNLTYSSHISYIKRVLDITRDWIVHISDCDVPKVIAAFNAAIISTLKDPNFIEATGHFVSANVVANAVY